MDFETDDIDIEPETLRALADELEAQSGPPSGPYLRLYCGPQSVVVPVDSVVDVAPSGSDGITVYFDDTVDPDHLPFDPDERYWSADAHVGPDAEYGFHTNTITVGETFDDLHSDQVERDGNELTLVDDAGRTVTVEPGTIASIREDGNTFSDNTIVVEFEDEVETPFGWRTTWHTSAIQVGGDDNDYPELNGYGIVEELHRQSLDDAELTVYRDEDDDAWVTIEADGDVLSVCDRDIALCIVDDIEIVADELDG